MTISIPIFGLKMYVLNKLPFEEAWAPIKTRK